MQKSEGAAHFAFSPVDRFVGEPLQAFDGNRIVFGREGDSEDPFVVLIGNNESPIRIEGHCHPGPLLFGNLVEQLSIETLPKHDTGVRILDELWSFAGESSSDHKWGEGEEADLK